MHNKSVEQMVVDAILKRLTPKRIILFGSRARGEAAERSDVDVAIDDEQLTTAMLAQIRADVEELPTLLHIDIVGLNGIGKIFHRRILKEGKILHERQS
jgi:predicted nucleotidyltransferase